MDFGAWVLIVEFLFFLISIPAAFLIIKKLTEETKTSDTIVIIRDTGRTGGYGIGNLISRKTGRNGRVHLKFMPRGVKNPKPIPLIVEPNKIESYPKPLWEKERNVIEVFPNSAQEFFNNMFVKIEKSSADTHIINAQREGINRQAAHLLEMGEGEISDTNLGLIKDFENKLLKSHVKDEARKGSSSYPTGETFRA